MEVKSYKDIGTLPLEFQDEDLLERVIELYGQFKNRGQIRETLTAELEFKKPISFVIIDILISRAKAKIREQLKIKDPQDYKGRIIYFIEILLGGKAKNRDKLKALEMLANYTGVEQQIQEEPSDYAKRVALAIKEMDASVDGTLIEGTTNKPQEQEHEREGSSTQKQKGRSQAEQTPFKVQADKV